MKTLALIFKDFKEVIDQQIVPDHSELLTY